MNYDDFLPEDIFPHYISIDQFILHCISLNIINPVSDFVTKLHTRVNKGGSVVVTWDSAMNGKVFCTCRKTPPNVFNTMLYDISQLDSKGKIFLDIISKYALYFTQNKCCPFFYDNMDKFNKYFVNIDNNIIFNFITTGLQQLKSLVSNMYGNDYRLVLVGIHESANHDLRSIGNPPFIHFGNQTGQLNNLPLKYRNLVLHINSYIPNHGNNNKIGVLENSPHGTIPIIPELGYHVLGAVKRSEYQGLFNNGYGIDSSGKYYLWFGLHVFTCAGVSGGARFGYSVSSFFGWLYSGAQGNPNECNCCTISGYH